MCGIAGLVTRRNDVQAAEALQLMTRAMLHRGPDGHGTAVESCGEWTIALAHSRLAILDVSARGDQPMRDPSGSRVLLHNGEIYNFMDLRAELEAEGYEFVSRSDTEVLLKGYIRWGTSVFTRLRGMFACAIWDAPAGRLVLARDSIGIKPLYFHRAGERILFASELRTILATGLVPRKLDRRAVASYLHFGSVETPLTIIQNIECVEPGECIEIRPAARLEVTRSHFRPLIRMRERPQSRANGAKDLLPVLDDSVRRHLISDVPVALFLSGGIDSTAIAILIDRCRKEYGLKEIPHTFNVSFDEDSYSEEKYASIVAKRFRMNYRSIRLTADGLLELIPRAIQSMDQPTMDGINTWVVAKAVRDSGIKVALSGLGGDELFAGYPSFQRVRLLRHIGLIPQAARATICSVGRKALGGDIARSKFWDMVERAGSPETAYLISRRLFSPAEVEAMIGVRPADPVLPEPGDDPINLTSRLELSGYMLNTLLRDTDCMSMSHSLEVRVPFIDTEVIDYVLALPGKWKIDHGRPKPLLLEALGELIPDPLCSRRKMGFTLPFRHWMLTKLQPDIDAVLKRSRQLETAGVGRAQVASVWQRFQTAPERERWTRPWSLYVLQKWCESNDVAA